MKISSIALWMTEDCNLNCDYCYENHNPVVFDIEKVKARLEQLFLRNCMNLKAEQYSLSFFGGEPLLEFAKVQELIMWIETNLPKSFKYGITTNGTLITPEIAQYLKDKNFGILFSIDGDREAMLARSDSYDTVVAGWQELQAVGLIPEANFTVTLEQLPRLMTNVQHIIDLGFTYFNLNALEPANYDFETTYNIFYEFYKHYINIWLPFGIKTSAIQVPFKTIKDGKTGNGCGAGKAFIGLSPIGEIYPCHHMIQLKAMKLSTEDNPLNNMKNYWESFDPKENLDCFKCPVNHLCKGSCAAVNVLQTGDLHQSYIGDCSFRRAKLMSAQAVYMQCTEEQINEVIGI